MDGAQSLYTALKKFDFTFENYQDLLDTYNAKALTSNPDTSEETLLRQTACSWLLSEARSRPNGRGAKKNYERWRSARKSKMDLVIGGIFPLTGSKFVARELIPSEYL